MVSGAEQVGSLVTVVGGLLLLWAGARTARAPDHRLRAVVELLIGAAALVLPGAGAAGLLAAVFAGFCLIHLRDWRVGTRCDCFGVEEAAEPRRAAALTALVAVLALGALALGAPSLRELVASAPSALAWLPGTAVLAAVAWRVGFSGPDLLLGLVDAVADRLTGSGTTALTVTPGGAQSPRAGGLERRDFLLRVAVVGSALAIAPLRYLLYPGTALAAVVRPWECGGGLCTDGYTAFCCEITAGGVNTCPADTFPGGWWMCTDYRGRQLCAGDGVRYYVDCNALPGRPFPGGCQCANGNCDERKINCNIFRYGQCNTQIAGTTAVVCRMIVCENPASISELNCSAALATDDSTCGHEAPCLEPPAVELAGAAGA